MSVEDTEERILLCEAFLLGLIPVEVFVNTMLDSEEEGV